MPREYDKLDRSDLDKVLEVNSKAIELSIEISQQYEELLDRTENHTEKLNSISKDLTREIEEIKELHAEMKLEVRDIKKSLDKLILLLGSGIVGLIIQIIAMFLKH